ncbi:response regulator [Sporosarcina gallistercoris]|uniref:response regulator n=1 Tax=Sporosarcina gallistercoris TaxID=2762245 RepID=UPI003D2BA94F
MKKLLIVDDQAGIRLLLDEVFKKEGYETVLASNGKEALLRVENDDPDCILLDMKMPGMDGAEVLRQVKSDRPDRPVVMMTAYDEIESADPEAEHRADHYFTKPFDIHEVRQTINKLLRER